MVCFGLNLFFDGPELERLLPKSDVAEAIGYMKNNWDALLLYTTDSARWSNVAFGQICLLIGNWHFHLSNGPRRTATAER